MATQVAGVTRNELLGLRQGLTGADDNKIARVVAMLDDMANNAVARDLLSSIRPRLAKLRSPRRLRFARLLFTPLDQLIVPPQGWKPGSPTIPRNALEPLARTVRATLGAAAAQIDAAIAGCTTHDMKAVARAGVMLWPQAASVLASSPPPIGWDETGLRLDVYPALAHAAGAALARQPDIQVLQQDADQGAEPNVAAIEALLNGIAEETPEAQALVVTLLLARLPQARPVIRRRAGTARGMKTALRGAEAQATATLIDRLESQGATEAQVIGANLAQAAPEVRRIAALIRELDDQSGGPDHRARMKALQGRLDAACRLRFAEGLTEEVLAPFSALPAVAAPAAQAAVESAARGLRALDAEGRRVGSAATYDAMMNQATAALAAGAAETTLSRARRVRLVEILAGPEAALKMLE